jgi:hypothetical protein
MDKLEDLLQENVWHVSRYPEEGSAEERIRISYQRARSMVRKIGMTVDDITQLSPKFWAFHMGRKCFS